MDVAALFSRAKKILMYELIYLYLISTITIDIYTSKNH